MRVLLIVSLTLVACGDDGAAAAPDALFVGADAQLVCNATCDPVAQTGCDATEQCQFIVDEAFSQLGHVGCGPRGTAAVGDQCQGLGTDECVSGAHCYEGVCHEICTVGSGSCSSGVCFDTAQPAFNRSDGCAATFHLCIAECDAIAQDCDDPFNSISCLVVPPVSLCLSSGGAQQVGQECDRLGTCDTGLGCHGEPSRCLQYCSRTGPTPGAECDAPQTCQPIAGFDDVGVCDAP